MIHIEIGIIILLIILIITNIIMVDQAMVQRQVIQTGATVVECRFLAIQVPLLPPRHHLGKVKLKVV